MNFMQVKHFNDKDSKHDFFFKFKTDKKSIKFRKHVYPLKTTVLLFDSGFEGV